MNDVQLGKLLSYVLRHSPQDIAISVDKTGWTDLTILVENLNRYKRTNITISDIKRIVETNSKKRYTLQDGKIKANQGHSIKGVTAFSTIPQLPPKILWHGTTQEKWLKWISKDGLLPMNRHHVHLSRDSKTAKIVSQRWKEEAVVLSIKAKEMFDEGIDFYVSENNVWLTDKVLPKYISNVIKV